MKGKFMEPVKQDNVPAGFDLMVLHRDSTGKVIKHNPYTLVVSGTGDGGKARMYERPVGSGNLWNKKGEPIGRWERDAKGKKSYNPKAEHVAFEAPLTEDQKLKKDLVEQSGKIEALERELAALRAEAQKKSKGG